jgi:hypothetical protein
MRGVSCRIDGCRDGRVDVAWEIVFEVVNWRRLVDTQLDFNWLRVSACIVWSYCEAILSATFCLHHLSCLRRLLFQLACNVR